MRKEQNMQELANFCKKVIMEKYDGIYDYYQVLYPNSDKPYVVHKSTYQMTVVLSGEGRAILNEKSFELCPNDVLFIEANTCHTFLCESDKMELFHIHIPKEAISNDREIIREDYYIN